METFEDIKTATNLKYGAKSVVVESINPKMILYTEAKKRPRKMQSKHGTGGRRGEPMSIDRETYCNDCDRSIYGKYHDCDVNIENDGKYVMADEKCYCKIVNAKRAEKYPWERRTNGRLYDIS